jgi:tetratricopeptide (TPR) repeat protein
VPDDMVDLSKLSARELLYRAHALLNANRVDAATEAIYAVCERYSAADEPVPPPVLSLYALCLARQGKRKEAVDTCRLALKREPRNPTCRLHMARIYLLANARRKAYEELEKGLAYSPENQDLRRFQAEMGKRRPPVIGFLSRDNPINIKLGKARAKGDKPAR